MARSAGRVPDSTHVNRFRQASMPKLRRSGSRGESGRRGPAWCRDVPGSTTGTDSGARSPTGYGDVQREHNRDGSRGAGARVVRRCATRAQPGRIPRRRRGSDGRMAWPRARSRRIGALAAQIDLGRPVTRDESVILVSIVPPVHIPRSAGAIQANTAVQTRRPNCPTRRSARRLSRCPGRHRCTWSQGRSGRRSGTTRGRAS
jgi:hypothetical protein